MINEQRALATLDLALKNAFETLDKYSLWVRTPEDSVTFNLVDAVPTLESNGTGIFLKPITVPSFAAVRSTIFGPQGTTAERPLYWNLRFKAVNGWIFEKNKVDDPTKLTVLVNTFFGANETPITITNTNVTENLVSSQLILDENSLIDFNNGMFRVAGDSFNANLPNVSIGVSDGRSKILGTNVVIGSANSAYSALTYVYSKNNLNVEKNSITLGSTSTTKQSTYSMVLRSGSLAIDLSEGKNFQMKMRNSTGVKSLLSAVYANGGYDIDFVEDGFKANRLYIGDVKNLKVTASDSLELTNDYGSLIFNKDLASLYGDVLKISSKTSTSIGSKTTVNIGIEDDTGVISKEIVVNRGSVVIPNLYVQKKANYQLSGVKHVTPTYENPSVKYIPNSTIKTVSESQYSFEYTKNISSSLYESNRDEYFDTTVNDHSGSLKSYLARVINSEVILSRANVTFDTPNYIVTSEYEDISVVGLSNISAYNYDPIIKLFSTPNGMYLMVRDEVNNGATYSIYYSAVANFLTFTKIYEYTLNFDIAFDVSIDYVTELGTDHIWFALSYACYGGTGIWTSDINTGSTYNVYYLKHSMCNTSSPLVYATQIEPKNKLGAYQVATSENPYSSWYYKKIHQYGVVGNTCKISAVLNVDGSSHALVMNAFACEKKTETYILSIQIQIPRKVAHAVAIMKYTPNEETLEEDELYFSRNDSQISAGRIVDFVWKPSDSMGYAIYATKNTLYSWVLGSSTFVISTIGSYKTRSISKLISSVSDTRYVIRSICSASRKAMILLNDDISIPGANIDINSPSSSVISNLGFMYFDKSTNSLKYYDNSDGGVELSTKQSQVDIGEGLVNYDINGFIVDYLGFNLNEVGGSFTSFVLSKNNENPFKLLNSDNSLDRSHYVETYNGDISTIIQSSDSQFTPSNISSEVKIAYDANTCIFARLSNTYSPEEHFKEKSTSIIDTTIIKDSLNFHIEVISYIAKNRNNNIDNSSIGKYTISKLSPNTYTIYSENNKYSGYRIPYSISEYDDTIYAEENQLRFSNMSKGSIRNTDLDAKLSTMYVTVGSSSLTIHSAMSLKDSLIAVTVPYQIIDPTNASYDPTRGIINEFNNVVAIRIPYFFGLRSRCCTSGDSFDGRSNVVFGLTEISDLGGDC